MRERKFTDWVLLTAILGAVFLLITAFLDAFIGVPKLSDLLLHSIWFQVGLMEVLWLTAFIILRIRK